MNHSPKYYLLTLLLICLPGAADEWRSVPTSSQLNYAVDFQGLPIEGQFKHFSVHYSATKNLLVTVDIGSADMSDDELNSEIAGADWFDAERFGKAVFSSDTIIKNSPSEGEFSAEGTLTLKGISKSVHVPFRWQQDSQQPNSASMMGQLVLQRSDFSIGIGDWSSGEQIGIDVSVSFSVLMQRQTEASTN